MFPDGMSKSIAAVSSPAPVRLMVSQLPSLFEASCIAAQSFHSELPQPDSSSFCVPSDLGEDNLFGKRLASFKALVSKTST